MKRIFVVSLALTILCAAAAWGFVKPVLDPAQSLERLQRGNERFVNAKMIFPNQDAFRRTSTAKEGQKPYATILSCSDSRVPLELIFDAGVGDLFVVRVAGNVTYAGQAATIEYGAEHLGASLLVVMGHTKCGAVSAVVNNDHVGGNLPALVANIVPAVAKAKADNPGLAGAELTNKAVEANMWAAIEDLYKISPMMRDLAKNGQVKVVGAIYDIETGKVDWKGEHPNQAKLLENTPASQ